MRRAVLALVLVGMQAGAVVAWHAWQRPADAPFLATLVSEPAPAAAPRDGLLHVWATWCTPCRDELPGLLAAARRADVALVAVSIDENPSSVDAFFGGETPPEVVREPALATRVQALPVTFRVREGRLVERVDGARDWGTPAARAWLDR